MTKTAQKNEVTPVIAAPQDKTAVEQMKEIIAQELEVTARIAAVKAESDKLARRRNGLIDQFIEEKRAAGVWPDWQILCDPNYGTRMVFKLQDELKRISTVESFTGLFLRGVWSKPPFVVRARLVADWPELNKAVLEGLTNILPYLPEVSPGLKMVTLESSLSLVLSFTGPEAVLHIEGDEFRIIQKNKVVEIRKSLAEILEIAAKIVPSYHKRAEIPNREVPY